VLWEHGGWGAGSAPVAAQVVNAFITKQRKRAGNLRLADGPQPGDSPTQDSQPAPRPARTVATERNESPVMDGVRTASTGPHAKPGVTTSSPIPQP